ncbi:MAG TPA: hypothetical protein VI299_12430 [Polyangiales bacterium]
MKRLIPIVLVGCAASVPGAPRLGGPEPRLLTETQALLAVREALVGAGALAQGATTLTLDGAPLHAEVRFGDPPFAIEWATADDRAHRNLPKPAPENPLQIVSASDGSQPVQVLVLDERAYAYEGNSLLVQRGAQGIEDAERRVRRDVTDFVNYVRDQGGRL